MERTILILIALGIRWREFRAEDLVGFLLIGLVVVPVTLGFLYYRHTRRNAPTPKEAVQERAKRNRRREERLFGKGGD